MSQIDSDDLDAFAASYRRDGYAIAPARLSASDLDRVRGVAERIADEFRPAESQSIFSTQHRDATLDDTFFESAQSVRCFLEEDATDAQGRITAPHDRCINKIGHALHDHEPDFAAVCRLPIWGELLNSIGQADPLLYQSMLIFKQPRIGGEVRWHQDGSYLIAAGSGVVGMWVALEDADRSNGCLWVQPGGHTSPLRELYRADASARRGELETLDPTPWPSEREALALEVPAGTVVVFSDRMPHYSAPNTSNKSRLAFTLHAADASAPWSSENWLQRGELPDFRLTA